MKKQYKPGDKYRPFVEILKLKKGVPSVIMVSGNRYILRNEEQDTKKEGQ